MNKGDALAAIRKAKSSHIKWRAFAQALIAGVEVSDDKIPKRHTECEFGKWYHGIGKKHLGHLESFKAIDAPHEVLHAVYARIYEALHDTEETVWAKLFTNNTERNRRKLESAQALMVELVAISETLLLTIGMLEQEVMRWSSNEKEPSTNSDIE
ncbi:hypothetical protein TI05_00550 [Achromatium sp. WMS3]|nr:hypothetical protein TI05_00550 [Achromatium sp. WMS3]